MRTHAVLPFACSAGWFQVKILTRSSFNFVLGIVYPLFFATVAFLMYRTGARNALFYASLGAAVMGVWAATSTSAGSAIQRQRWHGTLELLVAAPAQLLARDAAGDDRDVDDRALLDGGRRCSGGGCCSGSTSTSSTRCCSPSRIVVTVLSIGMFGFLIAVAFVRYRTAWALGNLLEYPVWLDLRLPRADDRFDSPPGAADLVAARADLGHATRSASGARAVHRCRDLALCAGLALLYTAIGVLVVDRSCAQRGRGRCCR